MESASCVIVIVVRNEHDNDSLNPERGCLHFKKR